MDDYSASLDYIRRTCFILILTSCIWGIFLIGSYARNFISISRIYLPSGSQSTQNKSYQIVHDEFTKAPLLFESSIFNNSRKHLTIAILRRNVRLIQMCWCDMGYMFILLTAQWIRLLCVCSVNNDEIVSCCIIGWIGRLAIKLVCLPETGALLLT